ncbi:MAG TPA: HD domain-containing protein, partial [Planctomycetota bacterium]|nr:HD domain-containing protein [Planctomycetota bacterium]
GRILARLAAGGTDLPARARDAVRAAALLHDVTHVPFGHTLEDERRLFERHDAPERTLRFLRAGELARAIDRGGVRDEVEAILAGGPGGAPLALLQDVVRGTVGADLLDYLARDAYFCGFRRTWDERLFRYFTAAGGRLALAIGEGGEARPDALSEVLHLLWLRYSLCERVYYHHAKVAAGAAVSKAVELALDLGLVLEDLFGLGDDGLLASLRARFAGRSGALAAVLDRIAARRLYKRAFTLGPSIGAERQADLVRRYHLDRAARAAAEAELAAAVGAAPEDVIVYCPAPGMAAKEADIHVVLDAGGPPRALADLRLPEVDVLVGKHRALWRFYVLLAGERIESAGALARACERKWS